ncbi:MAG: lytic transglycosylase domain-containing protein [Candidatus Acidiferrales bacterium]
MKRANIVFACVVFAWLIAGAPMARADYAVLRSGVRLHITGYESVGDRVRLTIEGGSIEVAASEISSIEPEDVFPSRPTVAPLPDGPYAKLIRASAEKHGIDENLIQRIILVESNFNPKAVSPRRAFGLMQLLPKTAAQYSVTNIFDPAQNIDGGTRYIKDLLARYHGDLTLALAAYNAGPQMVQRYGGVPPFPETQRYVRRVTKSAKCGDAANAMKCTSN